MKKILALFILFYVSINSYAQDEPNIKFVSTDNIVGNCDFGNIVNVEYKGSDGTTKTDAITVEDNNNFVLSFSEKPKAGTKVTVWSIYKKLKINTNSDKKEYIVLNDSEIVNLLTKKNNANDVKLSEEVTEINKLNAEKFALRNTTLTYKSTIISTNFTIPLVRFNFVEGDNTKQGDILLFNSIGAGIGYYMGRLERTRDNEGEIINEEFSNTLGASIGAIFSAGTGEDTKNVFAPVFNIALLDFQLGIGVELGTLSEFQKREFVTLSYSIPLYKLFKKSYRLVRVGDKPYASSKKAQE